MTNNITELVFILDKSGSMAGLEADTIGGFNAMIEKQKSTPGKCFVSTVAFNDKTQVIHDRESLDNIKPMTREDYFVGGCTALIDALGSAIKHISNIHKYARKEDIPQNTMFVITTDGMENASRKFTADEVRKMINRKKEESGWEFLFIGANIDAVTTAASYGISADRAVNYHCDKKGTKAVYNAVAGAVCNLRAAAPISEDWSREITEDFNSRNK